MKNLRRRRRRARRKGPLECRVCPKRAQVQLSHDDEYEMLCFEHLGSFIEMFSDPRVAEWSVVRL